MADKGLAIEMGRGLIRQAHEDVPGVMLSRAIDRPAFRTMEAVDAGRVQTTDPSLPGLGPSAAELAVQRRINTAQAQQLPEITEAERTPLVPAPERMSEAMNARLFPSGPSNDEGFASTMRDSIATHRGLLDKLAGRNDDRER
jgi:hypothetical protein